MSVLDTAAPPSDLADETRNWTRNYLEISAGTAVLMSGDEHPSEKSGSLVFAAHEHARALVRLIQCSQCSRPFSLPVTLPCGTSLCRDCLPDAHQREHVTYPDSPGRRQAFKCPFSDCGADHPASDCTIDVTLTKMMESIAETIAKHTSVLSDVVTRIEEVRSDDGGAGDVDMSGLDEKTPTHDLPGGRLLGTYSLAAQGKLLRSTELTYTTVSADEESQRALDSSLLQELIESARKEVDCHVCYNLMLDPVTTACGHTLCRKCLARVLDHSMQCPVCRRGLAIPRSLGGQPSNRTLVNLLSALCPETVAARAEALALEEQAGQGEMNVPIFVCTLSFPHQPTFLRIFEPRYRLMLRRCLEGNREFGMVNHNRYHEPQGDMGPVHFYQYGTMLRILHTQFLPDGTSIIETRGVYRFRVTGHGLLDGYKVGSVERVEDVTLAEEERIEAEETSLPPAEDGDVAGQINRMPTQSLLALGLAFIDRMQARSAPWLRRQFLDVHGPPPNDAALFPFWFASVLPFSDDERYKLLPTTTVRERLKITAGWIRRIESQRW